MLEFLGVLEKVSSILSVDRLAAARRRRIAKALVQLHESLREVVQNAHLLLENKPDDMGGAAVDLPLLERQVAALTEVKRLLSTEPLRSVLPVKWKPWPKFTRISEGKGYVLTLALASFYGLQSGEDAKAEVNDYQVQVCGGQHPQDPKGSWENAGIFEDDKVEGEDSLRAGLRDLRRGYGLIPFQEKESVPIWATPRQYQEAVERVKKLTELTENLRALIATEFRIEELG